MPTNCLKDQICKAAKPAAKLFKLFDGGGLYLAILPSGAKAWRIAYRVDGKPQTKSFGLYPEVSLAEARERRDAFRRDLRDGLAPERKKKRKVITLREASDAYWFGRNDITDTYKGNARRAIEMHLEKILVLDVAEITREDLLAELNVMNSAGHHVYVRKVRMWIGQVFEWAIEQGHTKENPAALINPKKAFGHSRVEHFAAIEPKEMADFMMRLNLERNLQSVLACKLLSLTWLRTNELRMLEWVEIDGDTIVIPEGKMKRPHDHVVPLPAQAVKILSELKRRCRGSKYVFPSEHRIDRPMSENAVLYLLHRIGYKGRLTGHGFRSVASTWANERGYNPDVIERQLAHSPENKVRSAYNRAAYLDDRRKMLQDYANWIDTLTQC